MYYFGLAIIWLGSFGFVGGICFVLTAKVLTAISYLDFVHESLFYGLSVLAGAFCASLIVRRVIHLQSRSVPRDSV
jgi:hypothetical protein